jgi:hypothetical protein
MGDWILLPGTRAMNLAQLAPEAMLRDAVTAIGEVAESALAAAASRHARSVRRLEGRTCFQSNICGLNPVGNFPDILSEVCEFASRVARNRPFLCTEWTCCTGDGRRRSCPRQTRLQRGARIHLFSTRSGAPNADELRSLESKRFAFSAISGGPNAAAASCSVAPRQASPAIATHLKLLEGSLRPPPGVRCHGIPLPRGFSPGLFDCTKSTMTSPQQRGHPLLM